MSCYISVSCACNLQIKARWQSVYLSACLPANLATGRGAGTGALPLQRCAAMLDCLLQLLCLVSAVLRRQALHNRAHYTNKSSVNESD
jgi:hypothetical protein